MFFVYLCGIAGSGAGFGTESVEYHEQPVSAISTSLAMMPLPLLLKLLGAIVRPTSVPVQSVYYRAVAVHSTLVSDYFSPFSS